MEKKEFKAGDKIIITKPNPRNNWNDKMDRYVDRILTIKSTHHNGDHTTFEELPNGYSDDLDYWTWNATQGHFKHYEEPIKEFPKFQITRISDGISEKSIIKEVVNNEGNTFEIGDIVIPFKYTPLCKKPSKIIRFRHTKDNSNICAVLDEKYPNGIGIDKLQHFVEFKPKEPEFVLPELWYVQVDKDNLEELSKWRFETSYPRCKLTISQITGMCKSVWSAKIGKGHNPSKSNEQFGIQITFEQFEKYVLKKQELPVQNVQELPQEESLLDKAKRLYPVGTKFKCVNNNRDLESVNGYVIVKEYKTNSCKGVFSGNSWIVLNDKWAEIVK